MNYLKLTLLILFLNFGIIKAQQIIVPAGGIATGEGEVSYTVGQAFHSFQSSETGSLTAGVQQTFDIHTSFNDPFRILSVKLFPNPTRDILHLELEEVSPSMHYYIYNNEGKLVESKSIIDKHNILFFGDKPDGIYYVIIVEQNSHIQSYKLIKN